MHLFEKLLNSSIRVGLLLLVLTSLPTSVCLGGATEIDVQTGVMCREFDGDGTCQRWATDSITVAEAEDIVDSLNKLNMRGHEIATNREFIEYLERKINELEQRLRALE